MAADGRRVYLCLNNNVRDASMNRAGTNKDDENDTWQNKADANERNMIVFETDPLLETKLSYGMFFFFIAKIFFSVCLVAPFSLFLFTKQQAVAHYAADREVKDLLVAEPVGVKEVKRNGSLTST